jgi:hypothetical protein
MQAIAVRVRQQWQSATWTDVTWILCCAVLFTASKWAGKFFEGVPGHAGAFWIPTLFLARATVGKPGAATMTALMGAAFWAFPKGGGSFEIAHYVAAGMVLDALSWNAERLRLLPLALLGGALCHLAKFGFHNVPITLVGISKPFLTWGMMPVVGLHLLFGLLGGFVGWLLLRGAERMRNQEK